jgi:LAS superfamily LD-carboxypeptidase LdcB
MKNYLGKLTSLLLVVLFITSLSSLGYVYFLKKEAAETEVQYAQIVEDYEERILKLENNLSDLTIDNTFLSEILYAEQNKNSFFEKQIEEIAGTVGTLDKLSKTDPELLQKYSRVYFLNEHYIPPSLTEIDSEYVYNNDKIHQIHTQALPFLIGLIQAAEENEITLKIISAYRSFGTQGLVKTGYTVTYGAGTANQFSADQGYSEHQLGTALDFTTPETGEDFSEFEKTKAFEWLLKNAYKYGFILSYPKNNDYYQFEPWHWRFVGAALANILHLDEKKFYDINQREIDQYLVYIFD